MIASRYVVHVGVGSTGRGGGSVSSIIDDYFFPRLCQTLAIDPEGIFGLVSCFVVRSFGSLRKLSSSYSGGGKLQQFRRMVVESLCLIFCRSDVEDPKKRKKEEQNKRVFR